MSLFKVKLKKKKFFDEYVLTNKHIICKFKYLIICFDHPDDLTLSAGFINLAKSRLEELFIEQNIQLDSLKEDNYFFNAVKKLKEWHPQITKLEVDCKNIYEVQNLSDYEDSFDHIKSYLNLLPNNNCIKSEEDFEIFKSLQHKIIDVKVSFQLIRKINKVEDYKVNFSYLHKLLLEHMINWNTTEPAYLDEVSIDITQLPYADKLNYSHDNNLCYVYPTLNLIPLHPIIN